MFARLGNRCGLSLGAGRVLVLLSCGLVAGLALVGCERGPSSPPGAAESALRAPEIVLDTPESAARSVLKSLCTHLRAVAVHDRVAATTIRDRVVQQIAARDEILSRHRGRAEDLDEYVERCVESWAAIVAYYADGIGWDRMRLEASTQPGRQVVRVPARGADHEAVIRVACVLGEGALWRVCSIDFAKPAAVASQPTSAPRDHAAEP